jgi:hypothetical protein
MQRIFQSVEGGRWYISGRLDALSSFPSARAAAAFELVLVLSDDADPCQVSGKGPL